MNKKKILWVSDSPYIHTGFGRVSKEICTYLSNLRKYEIQAIGWFNHPSDAVVPYQVHPTKKDPRTGQILAGDKFSAGGTFEEIVEKYKPDLVISLGDSLAENRVIPVKINGEMQLLPFEVLWEILENNFHVKPHLEKREGDVDREFMELDNLNILTLSHLGWKRVLVISRHYHEGVVAHVIQPKGHTVCTHNHSIMVDGGKGIEEAKPKECLEKTLANIEVLENSFCNKHCSLSKARLYGAYVSEGSATKGKCGYRVRISSMNRAWLEKLQNDVEIEYGKRGSVQVNNACIDGREFVCYNLVIWGIDIYNEFVNLCGKGSEKKRVPPSILNASKKVIKEFIRLAYEGDGYSDTEISYTTKSLQLASGISFLNKMLGVRNSIRYREEKETYTIRHIYGERNKSTAKYKVNNLFYSGYMYDLTVENAETFVDALGCVLCHNTWMVEHIGNSVNRSKFKHFLYIPIDGSPIPKSWADIFHKADKVIAYGKWGQEVIEACGGPTKEETTFIYHGVDTNIFKQINKDKSNEFKKSLLGCKDPESVFLVGQVSRNQPRKNLPATFKAFSMFMHGYYIKCSGCGRVTIDNYDPLQRKVVKQATMCKYCNSTKYERANEKPDTILYLHMCVVDCGWNLLDLQHTYDLYSKVLFDKRLRVGKGVSDYTLAKIYNSLDVMVLPTYGEGFGLPILEAMAAGCPVIATNYSAHPEWMIGEKIDPVAYITETPNNIIRGEIDPNLFVQALDKLYYDAALRKRLSEDSVAKAATMSWEIINGQWERMLDSFLYPDGFDMTYDPLGIQYKLEKVFD